MASLSEDEEKLDYIKENAEEAEEKPTTKDMIEDYEEDKREEEQEENAKWQKAKNGVTEERKKYGK
jgi:hypothetical protein